CGPYSDEHRAELSALSLIMEEELLKKVDKKAVENTIIILTADHGHLNVSPRDTIYLNNLPTLVRSLQRSASGKIIQPTGSPRDVFLHIEHGKIDRIHSYLSRKLKKIAQIIKTEDALRTGLFGSGRPHKEFRARIGDLLILPDGNKTIWYKQGGEEEFTLMGHHGGLSREEMLIPFGFANLSDLV
ncbi:alkaline phosphatase family protein, partial [[Eubacterium] cellulosolvens]